MVININEKQIGWHFTPTDEDLIGILQAWIQGDQFPELREVQFLDFEPSKLIGLSVLGDLTEWFFLVRRCMDTENNNTLKGRQGSWRLFDETYVRNSLLDQNENPNGIVGMKRYYCFYSSSDLPTSWIAYEYHIPSMETNEPQSQYLNDPDNEHSIIRLLLALANGSTYDMRLFHFEDHQIVDLLLKKNQGQEEFPQFGFVHFFSKEPYQLPVFKAGEKRMYMLRANDVLSVVDRWATPRGKWKIADDNTPATLSSVMNQAGTRNVGGKRLRKYYDHEDKPTVWNMCEYYITCQPSDQIVVRNTFFVVVLFKSDDSVNSAPKRQRVI